FVGKIQIYPSFNNNVKSKWAEGISPLSKNDLIFPVFISSESKEFKELRHLPMNFRIGSDKILSYLEPLINKGLSSVLLFGVVPNHLKVKP
ncbi:hypothetical protein MXB_2295, partial [Myxobolus squamalis]